MILLIICLIVIFLVGLLALYYRDPIVSMFRLLIKEAVQHANKESEKKLEHQSKLNEQKLEVKKDQILAALNNIKDELRKNQDKTFNLSTVVAEHQKVTEKLQHETNILNKTLSNNQLRGTFGQEIAESLLKLVGFKKGTHFICQEQQTTGNRPDFTFFLPNGTKVNIDSKFPFPAIKAYYDTENADQKKEYLNRFKRDIKTHAKELKSREYINPEENTVDFVIMFIPNEIIFSFIYENCPEERDNALKNKIFMCGPVSFTAVLRMIQQFSDNIKYQENLYKIVEHIKTFEEEYKNFSKELDKLGSKINDASRVYANVSGVRDRQLTRKIDKINEAKKLAVFESNDSCQR